MVKSILTSLPGDPALSLNGRSVDEAEEMLELADRESPGATVDSLVILTEPLALRQTVQPAQLVRI